MNVGSGRAITTSKSSEKGVHRPAYSAFRPCHVAPPCPVNDRLGGWLAVMGQERQNADSGCADILRHSQSLRSPANVMCTGEAHPASLLLARVSCARTRHFRATRLARGSRALGDDSSLAGNAQSHTTTGAKAPVIRRPPICDRRELAGAGVTTGWGCRGRCSSNRAARSSGRVAFTAAISW